jgi:hypothetical protein
MDINTSFLDIFRARIIQISQVFDYYFAGSETGTDNKFLQEVKQAQSISFYRK